MDSTTWLALAALHALRSLAGRHPARSAPRVIVRELERRGYLRRGRVTAKGEEVLALWEQGPPPTSEECPTCGQALAAVMFEPRGPGPIVLRLELRCPRCGPA